MEQRNTRTFQNKKEPENACITRCAVRVVACITSHTAATAVVGIGSEIGTHAIATVHGSRRTFGQTLAAPADLPRLASEPTLTAVVGIVVGIDALAVAGFGRRLTRAPGVLDLAVRS